MTRAGFNLACIKKGSAPSGEVIEDDYLKEICSRGAMALILVKCSYIGQSTADPFPVSLGYFQTRLTGHI